MFPAPVPAGMGGRLGRCEGSTVRWPWPGSVLDAAAAEAAAPAWKVLA